MPVECGTVSVWPCMACSLVNLDPCSADQFFVFGKILLDVDCEFSGRAADHIHAFGRHALDGGWHAQHTHDIAVQFADHRRRRVGRGEQTMPGGVVKAGREWRDVSFLYGEPGHALL